MTKETIIITTEVDEEGQIWVYLATALPKRLPNKNTVILGVRLETILSAVRDNSKEEPKYIA